MDKILRRSVSAVKIDLLVLIALDLELTDLGDKALALRLKRLVLVDNLLLRQLGTVRHYIE